MIVGIFFSVFGGFLTWVAVINWRHRTERISLIEATILKVTGDEPLPHTRFDRLLQTFQVIMASIAGPIFLLVGLAMVWDEIGI